MTWWKVQYDFKRPNWQAFGHVLFVDADSEGEAQGKAADQIAAIEFGATVTRLDVKAASDGEYQRFVVKVEARRRWQSNVAAGIPNQRGDL